MLSTSGLPTRDLCHGYSRAGKTGQAWSPGALRWPPEPRGLGHAPVKTGGAHTVLRDSHHPHIS